VYSIEPTEANRISNLLANNMLRSELPDKIEEDGPEVPLVFRAGLLACRGPRLARERRRPDWPIVWPSGDLQGAGPTSNSGEEMMLIESDKVGGPNIGNASCVHLSIRYQSRLYQLAQPRGSHGVELVVIGFSGHVSCLFQVFFRETVRRRISSDFSIHPPFCFMAHSSVLPCTAACV
jgi:hypothetical protein